MRKIAGARCGAEFSGYGLAAVMRQRSVLRFNLAPEAAIA